MTQVSPQHQRKILPACYFQPSEKISSSNNNSETELSSQVCICHYWICVKQGAYGCSCTCHSCSSFFPQRMMLVVQAGWKAKMRDKTVPKASLRLKIFFQVGQIFPLLPQLWKTNAHSIGCGSWAVRGCCCLSPESDMSASLQAQYQVSWRLARNKVEMGGKELHSYKSFRAFCEERDTAGIGKNHVHDNYEAKGSFWPHSSAKVSQKRRNVGYFLA